MPERITEVVARRERLIAKAALQRETLARDAQAWVPAVRVVDRAWSGVVWLREHPHLLLVAAGVMLVLRPRRTLRWSLRAFSVWQAYRRLSARIAGAGR